MKKRDLSRIAFKNMEMKTLAIAGIGAFGCLTAFCYWQDGREKEAEKKPLKITAVIADKTAEKRLTSPNTATMDYFIQTDKGKFTVNSEENFSLFQKGKKYQFSYYNFEGEGRVCKDVQPKLIEKADSLTQQKPSSTKFQPG